LGACVFGIAIDRQDRSGRSSSRRLFGRDLRPSTIRPLVCRRQPRLVGGQESSAGCGHPQVEQFSHRLVESSGLC
jgi:hypothetical protein